MRFTAATWLMLGGLLAVIVLLGFLFYEPAVPVPSFEVINTTPNFLHLYELGYQ